MPDGYSNKSGRLEPDCAWWMLQVRAGLEYRKKYAKEASWQRWRKYYRGEWSPNILPTNVFFKMMRTLVPRVYFRNPSVSIQATKPGTEYQILAKILQRADNKLIDRMKFKKQMKMMIQDGFLFGTGVGKLGYGAQYTPTPEMLGTDDPVKDQSRVEYHSLVHKDTPWFLRVPTGSFIVPAGLGEWEEGRWAAMWIRRPLNDVQDDPRFRHTAAMKPTRFKTVGGSALEQHSKEPLIDLVEIRDKKTQLVFVIAPFGQPEKCVFKDGDDLQIDGKLPYYPLIFNDDDEVFWGIPDAQVLDPQQREANEIRTLIMKHRRASIKKFASTQDNITPDEESKLNSEEVGAIIKVNELANFKDLSPSDIPAGLIRAGDIVERDVQEILGLGVNQFGEYAPGSADRSATEAQIVNQSTMIRTDERRDLAADLLVDFTQDMHHVLFERWSGEQVIDIIGPYGLQIWVKFTPEMLKSGSYDVSVDPDSSIPVTKDLREQKSVQIYGILKDNPLINPMELTQYLLHEFHGTAFDQMIMQQGMGMSPQQPISPQDLAQVTQGLPPALQQKMGAGPATKRPPSRALKAMPGGRR